MSSPIQSSLAPNADDQSAWQSLGHAIISLINIAVDVARILKAARNESIRSIAHELLVDAAMEVVPCLRTSRQADWNECVYERVQWILIVCKHIFLR